MANNTPRRMEDGCWYWVDKAIIRQYAPRVGAVGITVYNYLASLVDLDQTCFPSQRHIGEVLGYSRTTINRTIQTLERHRLIAVDKIGRYRQSYRLLDVRCSTGATEVLSGRNPSVHTVHTNKNKLPRYINNSGRTHEDIHTDASEASGLEPAIGKEAFALEIAEALDDRKNLHRYISCCRKHPEPLLRQLLTKAKAVPQWRIRKSRAALFHHLVSIYAEQENHNPGNQSRH